MLKLALTTLLGGVLFLFGLGFILYILFTLENIHILSFVIAGVSIVFGTIFLFIARKRYLTLMAFTKPSPITPSSEKKENLIQKQNRWFNEWNMTNFTRDKLKMLKIAAAAEDQAKKQM